MWRKYSLFPLLLMFVKLVSLITFLWIFVKIFNRFEISMKFCVFLYLFWFFPKNFFFKLWSQTRKTRRQKSKNLLSKCVLEFNFAPIKGSVLLIFFKKVKFVVPYCPMNIAHTPSILDSMSTRLRYKDHKNIW